jgi:uridine monophosphate synthetase
MCSPLPAYLLNLMTIKRTNLCLSADVTTSSELLQVAEELGDYICVLKTHADIVSDFSDRTIHQLKDIAARKHFLVFEDRKFADIGSTVQKQYTSGPLCIAKWAEVVTVHLFPGPAILSALEKAAVSAISQYNTTVHTEISGGPLEEDDTYTTGEQQDLILSSPPRRGRESDASSGASDSDLLYTPPRDIRKQSIVSISTTISTRSEPMSPQPTTSIFPTGFPKPETAEEAFSRLGPIPYLRSALVLAQMSSKDNFFTSEYTQNCVKVSRKHRDFVMGFISQQSLNSIPEDNFLTFTPGVKLLDPHTTDVGDGLGQQYRTPGNVIRRDGADIIIVGRGILDASNRRNMAERYRKEAWLAYEARIGVDT